MGLEDILTALEFSMSDRLDEIGDDLLSVEGVEDVLITYSLEKEVRPELMEVIKLKGVMNNFLNLSLEDREGVEKFRQENPGHLEGEGNEKRPLKGISNDSNRFIKEQRLTPCLLDFFDFYFKNRVDGEVFNTNYLRTNERLREEFGSKPRNLCMNAKDNFSDSGQFGHLINLAVKDRPDLKQYTTRAGLLEVDGTRDLISYFDFYLENRVDGEIFGPNFLQVNEKLKKEFGSKPLNLYANARNHFSDSGKLSHLIDLAVKDRPDLEQYRTFKGLLEVDGPSELLTYFDFYLENRVDFEIFSTGYLMNNKKLKEKFGSKPLNLYLNAKRHFGDSGKVGHLIDLAVKDRPDLEQYRTFKGLLEVDGPSELLTYFDFYLQNRIDDEVFDSGYLRSNKKLIEQFGSKPTNLDQNARRHFSEDGKMDHLVKLASEQRPEFLDYWRNGSLKSNEVYENES